MDIGRNVARLRRERGLTQKDLAELAGTTAVAMVESGSRPNPRLHTVRKIADALGVSIADLYTDTPDEGAA